MCVIVSFGASDGNVPLSCLPLLAATSDQREAMLLNPIVFVVVATYYLKMIVVVYVRWLWLNAAPAIAMIVHVSHFSWKTPSKRKEEKNGGE